MASQLHDGYLSPPEEIRHAEALIAGYRGPQGAEKRKRERKPSVALYLIRMAFYFAFGVSLVNFLLWLSVVEWRWFDLIH